MAALPSRVILHVSEGSATLFIQELQARCHPERQRRILSSCTIPNV